MIQPGVDNTDILTWLNGRATVVTIMHDEKPVTLWLPSDGVSIEDSVLRFCNERNIDIKKEAGT